MAAAVLNSMTPLASQPRPVLRRAVYVHVSDLTSAYNIDHARLEKELSRVKAEREVNEASTKENNPEPSLHNDDDPSNPQQDIDVALAALPQKRLQPPRGGYNLCVLVGKVNVVVDKRRVDRSRVRLAEVEIGDETGTVSLRARDEQIDILEEVSQRSGAVVLRNCTLELYQGKHIRLAVTKWGKLSTYPDQVPSTPPPPSKMNYDRNFSLIDLTVVANEMVDTPPPEHTYGANRQSKLPEPETRGSSGNKSGVGGGGGGLGSGGNNNNYHNGSGGGSKNQGNRQQTHSNSHSGSRRGNRGGDRRGRNKGNNNNHNNNNNNNNNTNAQSQQSHYSPENVMPRQMRYRGMHGFAPGYGEAVDMRQYQYPHRPQEGMPQPTAQHLLFQQQQYEMQQSQMRPMYHHDQQDHHRNMVPRPQSHQGHQLPLSNMLMPAVVGSSSFDATGEYPVSAFAGGTDQHPSMMAVVGNNPLLIPMGLTGSNPSQAPMAPVAQGNRTTMPSQARQGGTRDSSQSHRAGDDSGAQPAQEGGMATPKGEGHGRQHWGIPPHHGHSKGIRAESPFGQGKMNPQAIAFAPSYNPQGNPPSPHQLYVPVDPSQGVVPSSPYGASMAQQHAMYAQNIMYMPSVAAVAPAPSKQRGNQNTESHQTQTGSGPNNAKRNDPKRKQKDSA